MNSTDNGSGRLHATDCETTRLLVDPVWGTDRDAPVLLPYTALRFLFTRTAGLKLVTGAPWTNREVLKFGSRIYARTYRLVVVTGFRTVEEAVEQLGMLPLRVPTNGVAVNLDRVDDVDVGGHFGRLAFDAQDERGRITHREWLDMSRTGRRGILDAYRY